VEEGSHLCEKELLELLVCKVDAELLKRVVREVLKAEDVEEADVRQRGRTLRALRVVGGGGGGGG
jgi:hypothetical protein